MKQIVIIRNNVDD
jgi:hypothetical protein